MSDNFYPRPRKFSSYHLAMVASGCIIGGIVIGNWLGREEDAPASEIEQVPPTAIAVETGSTPKQGVIAPLPEKPFTSQFEDGQLLAYRLDTEIEGGGAEMGEFSDVYMKFGSDVTLYTQKVADDGTADLKFTFDNASVAGTFFDSPFEIALSQPTPGSEPNANVPENAQTKFLTTPIEMRVAADGTVLDISSPNSMKDMLGSIATIPHLKFPREELVEGMEWETELKLPVPGIGDAINTTVRNKLVGRERMGNYECGVVVQTIGAKATDTKATADPDRPNEKPMLFSVPLFDLQGENTIYFDLKTGRLIHAALDLDFALRIKEQLGDAGKLLQQLIPNMAGENSVPDLDKMLNPEGKPDLMDLSLKIKGGMSLVNEGTPLPMPQ
ncbi:MAG: hypothetical protein IT366_01425 [Candidatus Hydrogenedentes bacterium]|nr:hypothetical protein [Candidatus Hydrogenedentota bacterium]